MANVVEISSLNEADLSHYTGLTDVSLRLSTEFANGIYIAESSKVIERAVNAGHNPISVLLQPQWLAYTRDLLTAHDTTIYVADGALIEKVTGFNVHRGALAVMERPVLPDPREILENARRIVILEDIVDHTNVGAIFRAAAGLGAEAVLISPRCADPLYRRSVRVSMGTVLQVPWTRLPEWPVALPLLKEAGFHIAALALEENAVDLREFSKVPPVKVALLLGAEGDGLSSTALQAADTVVTIPMLHGVDSLNVASASAVALYALQL